MNNANKIALQSRPFIDMSPRVMVAFLLILLSAAISGFIIGIGNYALDAAIIAAVAGFSLLLMPLEFLFVSHFLLSVIISGTVVYFTGVKQAYWIPFGSATIVGVKVFLDYFSPGRKSITPSQISTHPFFLLPFLAYLIGILISAGLNRPSLIQAAVGLKNVIPCWAGFVAIAFGFLSLDFVKRVWVWMVAVPVINFPIVFYQHFVVGGGRVGGASRFDSVVGTFGGNPEAGGHSATLSLYMIACMLSALALYRAGRISRIYFWISLTSAFLAIVLSENKAAFVLIPIAFVIFDLDIHLRRPARFLMISASMGVVLLLMYKAYTLMYYDVGIGSKEALDRMEYFFDPNLVDRETGQVGRGAALAIWWADNRYTPAQRIFGYGPGASRAESSVAVGSVAKRYMPWRINATTAAQNLWDYGIFGFLSFLMLLGSAAVFGIRRYGWVGAAEDREILRAGTAISVVLMAYIFHNSHLSNYMQDQFLMTLALGTLAALGRGLVKGSGTAVKSRTKMSGLPGARYGKVGRL